MPRRPENLPARLAGRAVADEGARGVLPADPMQAMREKYRLLEAATAHLRDEYRTDHLRREIGVERRLDYGRPVLAGPVPGQARPALGRQAAHAGPAPAVPAPPVVAGGLPALIGERAAPGGEPPQARGWTRVRDMPGAYLNNEGIRAFMRRQHRQWPCFARHERMWEAAGRDPLGMVAGLNLVRGLPGSDEREIHAVAGWIRANGVVIAADRVDHGQALGHYVTEVVLATTDDKSFLLVREPADNGFEGMHIYCWEGGTAVYRDGVGRAFLEQKAQARALAAPQPRLPGPTLEVHAPEPPALRRVASDADRRTTVRALPAASSPSVAAMSDRLSPLRAAGFAPGGSKEGPFLGRREDDGTVTQVFGEKGKMLAKSDTFRIRSLDQDGAVLDERTVADPEDALRAPSSGPRP